MQDDKHSNDLESTISDGMSKCRTSSNCVEQLARGYTYFGSPGLAALLAPMIRRIMRTSCLVTKTPLPTGSPLLALSFPTLSIPATRTLALRPCRSPVALAVVQKTLRIPTACMKVMHPQHGREADIGGLLRGIWLPRQEVAGKEAGLFARFSSCTEA